MDFRQKKYFTTDGLLRGAFTTWVLIWNPFLNFIPINKSAIEQRDALRAWLMEVFNGSKVKWQSYLDWFNLPTLIVVLFVYGTTTLFY